MIQKIEHIAVVVQDLERTIQFYQDLFGFQLRIKGQNDVREMAFIYLESKPEVEIELIRDRTPTTEYSADGIVNHIAFSVENLDQVMKELQEKGITFHSEEPKKAIDGARMIFFQGLNKELLQLVERPG